MNGFLYEKVFSRLTNRVPKKCQAFWNCTNLVFTFIIGWVDALKYLPMFRGKM